jgi:uncharacterized protein YjiS (DUF1127 family)
MSVLFRKICDDWLAARRRHANIDFLKSLSDDTLQDIGVERWEIEAMRDEPSPLGDGASAVWNVRWPGMRSLVKAWRHYGVGRYSLR